VNRVWYPTRKDHPQHALARQQMKGAAPSSRSRSQAARTAAFSVMNAFGLIALSNTWETRNPCDSPATTTHMRIGPEERGRLGIR